MLLCEVYSIFTIVLMCLFMFWGREWPSWISTLSMLLPTINALIFTHHKFDFLQQILGLDEKQMAFIYTVIGGMVVIVVIGTTMGVNYITGWGKMIDEKEARRKMPVIKEDLAVSSSLLQSAGQEIGWRCYLLPCLMRRYDPVKALLVSAIISGIFHLPALLLLSSNQKSTKDKSTRTKSTLHPEPLVWKTEPQLKNTHSKQLSGEQLTNLDSISMLFQFISCVLRSVMYGWVSMQSGYSLWAPTITHYTWNRLMPGVLGNVLTGTPGQVEGPLWLIGGDGAAGCVVMLPIVGIIIQHFINY